MNRLCKYCSNEAETVSYRERSGQVSKEIVCWDCHYKSNEAIKLDMIIKPEHVDEALQGFNGYWANDYQACDNTADKHGYDRDKFKTAVYDKATF